MRVYNTTDGPLLVDRAGHSVGGREARDDVDVDAQPAKGHVEAGRLIVLDEPAADETKSTPKARRGQSEEA